MKATINRKEFLRAVKIAQTETTRRPGTMHTDCVLIEAQDIGLLRLVGANSEQWVTVRIPAEIEHDGRVCVNAKRLIKVVKALNGEALTLTDNPKEHKFSLSDQKTTCALDSIDYQDVHAAYVPDIPCGEPAPNLLDLAGRVLFAASEDDSRLELQCVNFNGAIAATDGFQLAMVHQEIGSIHGLVSARVLRDARRIFAHDEVRVRQDNERIAFSNGETTLIGPVVTGNYPDCKAIFPKTHRMTAEFLTAELIDGLTAVSALMTDHHRSVHFHFNYGGKVVLEAGDDEFSAETELQALITLVDEFTFPFVVAINPRMLLPLVRQAGESVVLLFNAANTPVSIWPTDPENLWRGVVMPMHLG